METFVLSEYQNAIAQKFFEQYSASLFASFFVTSLNVDCNFYIFDEVMKS